MATALKAVKPTAIASAIQTITSMRDTIAEALPNAEVTASLNERGNFTVTLRFVLVEDRELAMMKMTHGLVGDLSFADISAVADQKNAPGKGRLLVNASVLG
jgi:hypothetical protein